MLSPLKKQLYITSQLKNILELVYLMTEFGAYDLEDFRLNSTFQRSSPYKTSSFIHYIKTEAIPWQSFGIASFLNCLYLNNQTFYHALSFANTTFLLPKRYSNRIMIIVMAE